MYRSAAACARGRCRPDGYGCYRRGAWRFGFFLEFDRGAERPDQYAAKLAAYYRYRDSGAARRDYETFPTVLLVTTSDVAEARLAHQAWLLGERHASARIIGVRGGPPSGLSWPRAWRPVSHLTRQPLDAGAPRLAGLSTR